MTVAATTLNGAINASVTTVVVTDEVGFPSSGSYVIRTGSEWLQVTAGWGTLSLTVTRGYNGTTAAAALDGASVFRVPDTYADLARIKRRLRSGADTETTADDDIISDFIGDVQSYMVSRLGMFLGPTTSTTIDVDGRDALRGRTRLSVPFGIQSLTSIEVQPTTGDTFETVTAADVVSGPRTWESRVDPNQPFTWLMFKDIVTGDWSAFPSGVENVRITGTLGWSEPPNRLGELADTMVIRMFHAAASGQRDLVGNDDEGLPLVSRFISPADHQVLRTFWGEISSHRST